MGACYCGKDQGQRRFSKLETMFMSWNTVGYFDKQSLLSELSGLLATMYLVIQHNYKMNWNSIGEAFTDSPHKLNSQNIKESVRRGVADSDMHKFFEHAFDLTDHSYKAELKTVFSVRTNQTGVPQDISIFPTFSENVEILKAVNKLYINDEGKKALKRIMWVLCNLHPEINFSPQIVNIVSLLLVYCTEEETYAIMKKLIHSSAHEKSILGKHITFSIRELCEAVGIIIKVLQKKSEELIEYMAKKNISLSVIIGKIFMSFGVGYFPYALLARLLASFIVEGNKAYIKIIISMFVIYSETLMSENIEDLDEYLKKCFCSVHSIDLIMKKAFKIKLSRFNFSDTAANLTPNPPIYLYRPVIEKPYDLFKESDLQLLWGAFPHLYRNFKPKLVYSSNTDGISLRTLLTNIEAFESRTPVLLAVQSERKNVYGVFVDCALRRNHEYVGGSECFLFQLVPEFKVFHASGKNSCFAWTDGNSASFGGGGHGSALSIDKYITTCQSYCSDTFLNPVFEDGFFNVLACEVLALVL